MCSFHLQNSKINSSFVFFVGDINNEVVSLLGNDGFKWIVALG